jgi:hypothetical protein
MKIEITPSFLKQHFVENTPATITIGRSNISFSLSAQSLLALKNKDKFNLEFEDGTLYFKESNDGFTLYESGKSKILAATAPGIVNYLNKLYKTEQPRYRFFILDMKFGRRALKVIS